MLRSLIAQKGLRISASSVICREYAVRVTLNGQQTFNTRIAPNNEEGRKGVNKAIEKFLTEKAEAPTQLVFTEGDNPSRRILVSAEDATSGSKLRSLICDGIHHCSHHNITEASVNIDDFPVNGLSKDQIVDHITRTAILGGYQFTKYKKPEDSLFESLEIYGKDLDQYSSIVERASKITEGTLLARELGNEQADVANPQFIEEQARKLADENPNFNLRVIKGKEVEELGLNMLQAVGQAARWEPRLILLEYKPIKDDDTMPIVLLGKGITFDTGGLNLKPTNFIENMHLDMCGSAAVLGTAKAASSLNLQKNIVFALSVAENSISEKAYKPGAILKSHAGLTVKVGNTDAEGRLVLADALSYTQEIYKPKIIIDLATLTGACVVALGEYAAGVFSNQESLQKEIAEAGSKVQERCWPLPIFEEHTNELKTSFADTCSTGKGRYGGASTAAAFLQKFIKEDTKWAHIDIAGPAMYSETRGFMTEGSTGFGVQTLIEFLESQK